MPGSPSDFYSGDVATPAKKAPKPADDGETIVSPPLRFELDGLPANTVETTIGQAECTDPRTIFYRVTYLIRDKVSGKGQVSIQRVSIQGDPTLAGQIGNTSEFSQSNMTSAGVVNCRLSGTTLRFNFTNNALNVNPINVVVSVEVTLGPTS